MSIMYCEKHNRKWDSDFLNYCPECENEFIEEDSDREMFGEEPELYGLKNLGDK